jgi:hypothetical protein
VAGPLSDAVVVMAGRQEHNDDYLITPKSHDGLALAFQDTRQGQSPHEAVLMSQIYFASSFASRLTEDHRQPEESG